MTPSEQRIRRDVRNMAGDWHSFTGYVRGLIGHDDGVPLARWALDEQKIMLEAGEWK